MTESRSGGWNLRASAWRWLVLLSFIAAYILLIVYLPNAPWATYPLLYPVTIGVVSTIALVFVLRCDSDLGEWTSIPLGLSLLAWPDVYLSIRRIDSWVDRVHGVPLPWRKPSVVTSLAYDIAWIPFAFDCAAILLLAFGIVRFWRRREFLRHRGADTLLATAVWLWGVWWAIQLAFITVVADPQHCAWYCSPIWDGIEITGIGISFRL